MYGIYIRFLGGRQRVNRLAQLDKACAYGARDWGFESLVGHFLCDFFLCPIRCCSFQRYPGYVVLVYAMPSLMHMDSTLHHRCIANSQCGSTRVWYKGHSPLSNLCCHVKSLALESMLAARCSLVLCSHLYSQISAPKSLPSIISYHFHFSL